MGLTGTWRIRPGGVFLTLMAACAAGVPSAFSQESASYVMNRVTVSSTADFVFSPSFEMAVTFAQEGPVGSVSVCNDGAFQSTGFWSIVGDPPASIVLDVFPDPPGSVDLAWTGSAQLFEILRGELADTVPAPANSLATTSLCAASDTPPGGVIFYYLVVSAGN